MTIKIAVIGPADFIQKTTQVAECINDIKIEPYIYLHPEQAAAITQNIKPCDIVLYSGSLPYYFSKDARKKLPIPALFMKQDEMTIAASLLSVVYKNHIPIEQISIDLFHSESFINVLKDIQSTQIPYHVIDYVDMLPDQFDTEKMVYFHYNLYKSGVTKLALTSIYAVHDRLLELGVPAKRMVEPTSALIRVLSDAKAEAELIKRKFATVAVCQFSFPPDFKYPNEYFTHFANEIQAFVKQKDDTTFLLFSTRGNIEKVLNTNVFQQFLLHWEQPVTAGFGYGETAADAEQNAEIAYRFARHHENEACGYILTENKELRGPFPQTEKVQHLKNDHPELLQLAKAIGISPANLSKIIQFSQSRKSLQFTAADLENYLQVTRRSTERLIKKLADHGAVKIVGEEMTYRQGRPRTIYELNIPVYK